MTELGKDSLVKQIQPAMDLDRPVKLILSEAAQDVQVTKYASGNPSTSSIQFNSINPPSANTIIDRRVMVRAAFRLTFTGTDVPVGQRLFSTDGIANPPILDPVTGLPTIVPGVGGLTGRVDAPRAYPLSQMLQSIIVKLNGQNYTQTINDYIEPLMRYSSYRDVAEEDWSLTPNMPDYYKDYADAIPYGFGKDCLGNYGVSPYRTGRGGFYGINVVSQTVSANPLENQTSVVDVEFTEPLFISPLAFGKKCQRGFLGVDTMQVTLNIDSQWYNRVWSHDATSSGKTIKNIALSYKVTTPDFATKPEIMFTYLTPQSELPKENLYPYHSIIDYIDDNVVTVGPGVTKDITINNIQLSAIPQRIYLIARRSNAVKTYNDTDTYARLKGLSILFANRGGRLSSATEQQLYKMCVRNGLKMSWSEWTKHVGSVMCVDFSKDIAMTNGNYVGKSGPFQFSAKMTVQNISTVPEDYQIHAVVVGAGFLNIDGQSVMTHDNLGDVAEFYDLDTLPTVDWAEFEDFYGAGIADKLRSLGSKISSVYHGLLPGMKSAAHKLAKYARDNGDAKLAGVASAFAEDGMSGALKKFGPIAVREVLSMIPKFGEGLGEVAEASIQALVGSEEYLGSGPVGGKAMSKASMKKRLGRY